MSLIAVIPLEQVKMAIEAFTSGFEGFTLVWGVTSLKVYKSIV